MVTSKIHVTNSCKPWLLQIFMLQTPVTHGYFKYSCCKLLETMVTSNIHVTNSRNQWLLQNVMLQTPVNHGYFKDSCYKLL
jgi:hypothetical protein